MYLPEGIIRQFIEKVEKGEKQYAQLSHDGYAMEVYKELGKKYPGTVMVKHNGMAFIAITEEGKARIRERLQPEYERAVKTVKRLEKYTKLLGNAAGQGE